jgi:hypothetical protein
MSIQIDDFDVQDCGTIILLRAISKAAVDWVDEHLPEDRQTFADATVIERRYFEDIYDGIVSDGLSIS